MKKTTFDHLNCSVARTLERVGDWWTLLIIREAFFGVRRFNEFERRLGVARNVLSDRLGKLVDNGILERIAVTGRGNPQDYLLTQKGRDLFPVIVALLQWGDKWVNAEHGAPVILKDRQSGHVIGPVKVTTKDHRPLKPSDVVLSPGPGADDEIKARIAALNRHSKSGRA